MTLEETIRRTVREEIERADLVRRVSEAVAAKLSAVSDEEVYLTTAEAAKIAKVNQDTIRAWVACGKLTRCGSGRVRVKKSELLAYLELRNAEPSGNQIVDRAKAAVLKLGR